jgi:hypothetical protein
MKNKTRLKTRLSSALIAVFLLTALLAKSQDSQLLPTRIYGTQGTAFVYTNITGNIEQKSAIVQHIFSTP